MKLLRVMHSYKFGHALMLAAMLVGSLVFAQDGGADLTINLSNPAMNGDKLQVKGSISNKGSEGANDVLVRVTIDGNKKDLYFDLAPGAKQPYNFSFQLQQKYSEQSLRIKAAIDPLGLIEESDIDNNNTEITYNVPKFEAAKFADLSISLDSLDIEGTNLKVIATVSNEGTMDVTGAEIDAASGSESKAATVDVPAGGSTEVIFRFSHNKSERGKTRTVTAQVDSARKVKESNDNNNNARKIFDVPESDPESRPDLVVFITDVFAQGSVIQVEGEMGNDGAAEAPDAILTISAGDKSRSRKLDLDPGDRQPFQLAFNIKPEDRGQKIICKVVVDPRRSILEKHEDNNIAQIPFVVPATESEEIVTAAPVMYPRSKKGDSEMINFAGRPDFSVGVSNIERSGSDLKIYAKIANTGNVDAAEALLRLEIGDETVEERVNIKSESEEEVIFTAPASSAGSGEVRVRLIADPGNEFDELVEDNNRANTYYKVPLNSLIYIIGGVVLVLALVMFRMMSSGSRRKKWTAHAEEVFPPAVFKSGDFHCQVSYAADHSHRQLKSMTLSAQEPGSFDGGEEKAVDGSIVSDLNKAHKDAQGKDEAALTEIMGPIAKAIAAQAAGWLGKTEAYAYNIQLGSHLEGDDAEATYTLRRVGKGDEWKDVDTWKAKGRDQRDDVVASLRDISFKEDGAEEKLAQRLTDKLVVYAQQAI